jgi:hypothetical protein
MRSKIWIGGWMNLRAGLADVGRRKFLTLPGLELRTLGRFNIGIIYFTHK